MAATDFHADEGVLSTVDPAAEAGRRPFYDKAAAHNLAPLWRVLQGLVTDEPKLTAVSAHWRCSESRDGGIPSRESIMRHATK
jgi:gentisate 1,2-dioxygenase